MPPPIITMFARSGVVCMWVFLDGYARKNIAVLSVGVVT
jgi:hypothetical protein